MLGMPFREVPSAERTDAEILAAVQQLVPVPSGDVIKLMSRQAVMDRIEELRLAGDQEGAHTLLSALEFDDESVFRRCYTQMASRSVRVRTSTLFRMLKAMAVTMESRNDMMRRLVAPVLEDALDELAEGSDDERVRLLRYSLDSWAGAGKPSGLEEIDPDDVTGGEGAVGRPVARARMGNERLPPELSKYARYFLKNLFRLNNIHGHDEFYHSPQAVEAYWEVVAPEQGVFHAEMAPASGSLTIGLYHTSRSFGLDRSEDPDYFGLLEMLASERRDPRVKGCRVGLHGATREDEIVLQEALSVETMLAEDPAIPSQTLGIPLPLSAEGRELFVRRLHQLSGVRADVLFPINPLNPGCGDQDFSVLGFDLGLDARTGRFVLDGAPVSEESMDEVAEAIGGKLLALSRHLYRDPPRFPQPDVDALDAEVHALIARAESDGLSDELTREIVAKITVLDYYESLAKYSRALGEQVRRYLEGTQVVTFTIPRALLAVLDRRFEEEGVDEIVLSGLGENG